MSYGKLGNMTHEQRMRAITKMREKHPVKYRVQHPDLSVEQRTAPCSNDIRHRVKYAKTGGQQPDAQKFPVGNSHKQGLQLVTPGAIANGELKHLGGKKT